MPFTLIKGQFVPGAGIPDGDSVRFRADNLALWNRLEGRAVAIGTGAETLGTAQLRLEGIDAIEKGATQPLATNARDNLFALIGYEPGVVAEPEGFILARMTDDTSRRPIAFAFAGMTERPDGDDVFLDVPLLAQSVNYQQMTAGFAYPLYYNTLFASLRNALTQAHAIGRLQPNGYFPHDATLAGVTVPAAADLETIPPIWPKLWRRLQEYFRHATSLAGFIDFLEERDERIDILSIMEERGLQDLVVVAGDTVRLLEPPENLRVVGDAGQRHR